MSKIEYELIGVEKFTPNNKPSVAIIDKYIKARRKRKLKKCPFCGKKGMVKKYADGTYKVCCENFLCPAETFAFRTEKEAVDKWNKRIYEELFAIGDDVWIVTDRNAVGAKICTIAKHKDPYFNGVMYTAEFFVNGERCSKRFVEEDIGESVFLTEEGAKEKCGC